MTRKSYDEEIDDSLANQNLTVLPCLPHRATKQPIAAEHTEEADLLTGSLSGGITSASPVVVYLWKGLSGSPVATVRTQTMRFKLATTQRCNGGHS